MNKFKVLLSFIALLFMISSVFSHPANAQMQSIEYYEGLGSKILKGYDYNSDTGKYTFDKEVAKEESGLSEKQIIAVENHLKTLDASKLQLIQNDKEKIEGESGSKTRAIQLAPLIGAAAIGIVAAVGTTVATKFAEDIYNYGLTKACQNFKKYNAIKDFCVINKYI
ncbi:hypothetical protein [Mammaliicoccus sp. Dog046]|uniref:hypothetical protein n=1 Tax=Mammaliicoccus sp. Dog046 TaxID=3034233 RepID=UPI002B2608AB|nr:hypothetical protein [Mammaliicoccus sp. Dog046]WQK85450.1 hypothetical protein P3U32_12730 [Mammaliicoccus sp. Dog046]